MKYLIILLVFIVVIVALVAFVIYKFIGVGADVIQGTDINLITDKITEVKEGVMGTATELIDGTMDTLEPTTEITGEEAAAEGMAGEEMTTEGITESEVVKEEKIIE